MSTVRFRDDPQLYFSCYAPWWLKPALNWFFKPSRRAWSQAFHSALTVECPNWKAFAVSNTSAAKRFLAEKSRLEKQWASQRASYKALSPSAHPVLDAQSFLVRQMSVPEIDILMGKRAVTPTIYTLYRNWEEEEETRAYNARRVVA